MPVWLCIAENQSYSKQLGRTVVIQSLLFSLTTNPLDCLELIKSS